MASDWDFVLREVMRKAFHLAGLAIPVAYYFFVPRELAWPIMAAIVAIAGVIEILRLMGYSLYDTRLMRDTETKGRMIGGYFYALFSMLVALLVFSKTIACAAMLCLILGDALTGLAGAVYYTLKKQKPVSLVWNEDRRGWIAGPVADLAFALRHPKPPAVMLVMLIVCCAVGLLFRPQLSYLAILASALGAMIADGFPWRIRGFVVDDNLSIPLITGLLMTIATML